MLVVEQLIEQQLLIGKQRISTRGKSVIGKSRRNTQPFACRAILIHRCTAVVAQLSLQTIVANEKGDFRTADLGRGLGARNNLGSWMGASQRQSAGFWIDVDVRNATPFHIKRRHSSSLDRIFRGQGAKYTVQQLENHRMKHLNPLSKTVNSKSVERLSRNCDMNIHQHRHTNAICGRRKYLTSFPVEINKY